MDPIALLIEEFSPALVWKPVGEFAEVVATRITPVLIVLAILIRGLEDQYRALTGQARWGAALRDALVLTFITGSYFGLADLVVHFFNGVYQDLGGHASVRQLFDRTAALLVRLELRIEDQGIKAILSAGTAVFGWGLYLLTHLVLVFIHIGLRIAMAIGFGLVLIWGLIAIPVSITGTLRILQPWGRLAALMLVWPIAESLLLGLIAHPALSAIEALISLAEPPKLAVYLVLAVLELVIAAALLLAPFVARALIGSGGTRAGGMMWNTLRPAAVPLGRTLSRGGVR